MAGIAGAIDLTGKRPVPAGILRRMAEAMRHRGPDEEGSWGRRLGIGLVSRRLCVVGSKVGRQPITNEDQSVVVVYNGELFEYADIQADLKKRGHCLKGRGDTELLPHLWEEYGRLMLEHLRGQFALAVWDDRNRRLLLARDRFGICPLHWTRQDDWLLFASEIKALLASGMVEPRADRRAVAQAFTFFGLPGPVTCFEGVSSLPPGHYLDIQMPSGGGTAAIRDRSYWELDFPDCGQEDDGPREDLLVEEYESIMLRALERRLRADVPVAAYSSGGLDSSMLISMARKLKGEPLTTFTFAIEHPTRQESAGADIVARHVGTKPNLVQCCPADVIGTYPRLVAAAESPVIDVSAAALFMLAEAVHQHGFRAVITGEGADEWQAGYPWFRINKKVNFFNLLMPAGHWGYWAYACWVGSQLYPPSLISRTQAAVGGHNAWLLPYHLMSTGKWRFFSRDLLNTVGDYMPFDDLGINLDRMRRWHPMNRAVYIGGRIHLPGLHLHARGDRSAMHSSVEARYPFLDEEIYAFLARLHPRWKQRGFKDKYLQRLLADRWLPPELTRDRKQLLHAPLEAFHQASLPPLIKELLSERELRRTGYFDPRAVSYWRRRAPGMAHGHARLFVEMGLVGVISTQLWHHAYVDGKAAEWQAQ